MNDKNTPITVAYGDGIGPEIMAETLLVLKEAGARLEIEEIEIGEKVYQRGVMNGIEETSWDSLRRNKIFLKAPITTPRGGGFKSLNVTIRKSMAQFANVRPCVTYHPFVNTMHPGMDMVIVRENEEDLYGGIEYQQTDDVYQSIKLITRQGTERICRYAFEYARANARKKVTCMIKDNIMKISDGAFRRIFEEIGEEYPDIEKDNMIIDIGTAKVASNPKMFDVLVMPNLYGDIVSDVAAEVTGSVGLCGSANIGEHCSMFEAIHGSAPDIAGKGIANPSGLIHGAIMMLVHIGQGDVAENIHNAWLKTLEQGIHTGDVYREGESKQLVNTKEFTAAVIKNLGQKPEILEAVDYTTGGVKKVKLIPASAGKKAKKTLKGVDIVIHHADISTDKLVSQLQNSLVEGLSLHLVSSRGTKVWPEGMPETYTCDHWRCRFKAINNEVNPLVIVEQLQRLNQNGLEFVKIENLYDFDGVAGYSKAQGE